MQQSDSDPNAHRGQIPPNGNPVNSPDNSHNEHYDRLLRRLTDRTAIVGVIGLGYVGLPLADTLHSSGLKVVGYDTDTDKIAKLKAGVSYIQHMKPSVADHLSSSNRFLPTSDFAQLETCDVLIMCLPTPVGAHNEPDMSYVLSTTQRIARMLRAGTLIVLESTTYPGATDTDISAILSEASGLSVGHHFFLAYSPEREDPGNKSYQTRNIPKLVGGVDPLSSTLAQTLYNVGGFDHTVQVSSARVAECAKLLENIYRAVNIALVNELKQVFDSMDVNIWEIIAAAETKPFGYHRFDPGPGIGGHCIPVDPFYLTWKAKETGAPCSFIELATTVNANMPRVVVNSVQAALNLDKKSVNGSNVLLLGIAYKPDVDDIREAPALVIWELLLDRGASVQFYDPYVPTVCHTRRHMRLSQSRSVEKAHLPDLLPQFDAAVLVTHHACFDDYAFMKGFSAPVVDTRNHIPKDIGLRIVRA